MTLLWLLAVSLPTCKTSTTPTNLIAGPFTGDWINEDPNTRGITRVEFRTEGDLLGGFLFVHMWASCSPTDCDWGEVTAPTSDAGDNRLSLEWNQSFVVRSQTVTWRGSSRLRVEDHSRFTDNSGRADRDAVYDFRRDRTNLLPGVPPQ